MHGALWQACVQLVSIKPTRMLIIKDSGGFEGVKNLDEIGWSGGAWIEGHSVSGAELLAICTGSRKRLSKRAGGRVAGCYSRP